MASHPQQPIGIFDSGIGGLTVANSIRKKLPNERIIYFGDTAHLPYGDKSIDVIKFYSLKIAKLLLEQDCKMIIIACNSASAAAYEVLKDFFGDKCIFVNVIDPLVQAVANENYKKIGVIATKMTVHSNVYKNKLNTISSDIEVCQLATPLLIPMIEEGYHDDKISQSIISNYLENPILENIDALLLACTHFPLIKNEIQAFYKDSIDIMDSTDVAASFVENQLQKNGLLSDSLIGKHEFFVSVFTQSFEDTTKLFYDEEIDLKEISIW